MIPVEITEAADADLTAIFEQGAELFGDETAAAYLRSFDKSFDLIAEHPRIGTIHDIIRPPIHSLSHGSHKILYDVSENRVIVRRILHKAMDVERHLRTPDESIS